MSDLGRAREVESVSIMTQGALYGAMDRFIKEAFDGAKTELSFDKDQRPSNYMDIVLKDGWRIRFTRTIVPPEQYEENNHGKV